MARVVRWLVRGLGGLVVLLLLAGAVVYIASEVQLRKRYVVPARAISIPTDSGSITEGARMARLRGCYGGCHGDKGQGSVFFDQPGVAKLIAPNLTTSVRKYSDSELERMIRHGSRPNGRTMFAMPSTMFSVLSDGDVGRILAFLQSLPPMEGPAALVEVRPLARVGIVTGQYVPMAKLVAQDTSSPPAMTPTDSAALGRYLARTVCTECHGIDPSGQKGGPGDVTPDLALVAAYGWEDFQKLMQTGKALGGREVGLMSRVARSRFVNFTGQELRLLYGYLRARAEEGTTP